jgi:hypothetical protein
LIEPVFGKVGRGTGVVHRYGRGLETVGGPP